MRGKHRNGMTGPGGTEAEVLRAKVSQLLFEVNTQLSSLATILQAMRDTGQQTSELVTHNLDVAQAAALLSRTIPDDLESAIPHIRLVIQIFERYRTNL